MKDIHVAGIDQNAGGEGLKIAGDQGVLQSIAAAVVEQRGVRRIAATEESAANPDILGTLPAAASDQLVGEDIFGIVIAEELAILERHALLALPADMAVKLECAASGVGVAPKTHPLDKRAPPARSLECRERARTDNRAIRAFAAQVDALGVGDRRCGINPVGSRREIDCRAAQAHRIIERGLDGRIVVNPRVSRGSGLGDHNPRLGQQPPIAPVERLLAEARVSNGKSRSGQAVARINPSARTSSGIAAGSDGIDRRCKILRRNCGRIAYVGNTLKTSAKISRSHQACTVAR